MLNLKIYQIKKENYYNQKNEFYSIYLEKYKIHVLVEKKDKKNSLESIIENIEDKIKEELNSSKRSLEESILKDYKKILNSTITKQYSKSIIDQKTGAQVFYVPPSTLPANVLGMYIPSMHTIYISNALSPHEEKFVYHHEIAHASGIKDESLADAYAASIVGYNLRQAA